GAIVLDRPASLLVPGHVTPVGEIRRDLALARGVNPPTLPPFALEQAQDRELGEEMLAVHVDHRCGLLPEVIHERRAAPHRESDEDTRERIDALTGRREKRVR